MAESAASFLFNQLTLLLREEQKLLRGIGDNAVYIRDELGQMRAFLRAADEKEESDSQLKEWVKQVTEITYDTEDLPNLVRLQMGMSAYEGEELIFKGRKFKKLERLSLLKLRGLKSVGVEKDCMPHLKELDLRECEGMEELPEGIEQLRNLQRVEITRMSEKFKGRLAEQKHKGGNAWKLAHVGRVEVWDRDGVSNEWKVQQLGF